MAADGGSGNGSNIIVSASRSFARPEQTFPTLTEAEIARMRQFGELKSYSDGELMFETGKPGRGMFVMLSGHVAHHRARRSRPRHADRRAGRGAIRR